MTGAKLRGGRNQLIEAIERRQQAPYTIVRTIPEFRRRDLIIQKPRDRPILKSQSPTFPRQAHFPTNRAGLISTERRLERIDLISQLIL